MEKLFLDLETTGLSPKYASILEVAAIVVDMDGDNMTLIDSFHEYIRPYRPIPAEVVELTGISNEQVINCRSEVEVLNSFASWLIGNGWDNIETVAHNGAFDFRFLTGRSHLYSNCPAEIFDTLKLKLVDTLPMARKLIKTGALTTKENRANLETLAETFNIVYDAHSAIEDTKALIEVYRKMKKINGGV